jgi:hypothetical protein
VIRTLLTSGIVALCFAASASPGAPAIMSGTFADTTADSDSNLGSSATGSGQTTIAGELRTFSFTARMDADGTTTGVAQVNNRAIEEMFQLRLDCLRTFGNTAIVSGVFTRHTDSHAVGLTGIFAIVDSGEGAGPSGPDLMTQVFFFPPNTLTCADISPADASPFLTPVEAGNVQVH